MRKPKPDRVGADGLTDAERRDILLWFGWGAMLGYDTSPIGYLREAMKPDNKALFLATPRRYCVSSSRSIRDAASNLT